MWDNHYGFDLGNRRIVYYKDENVLLELRNCIFCGKKELALQFAFTENYTCINCLLDIINSIKLFQNLEENNLLKSSENLEVIG